MLVKINSVPLFIVNDPISCLIGAAAIGFGALIYEKIAEDFEFKHLEIVRKFRKRYLQLGFPATVIIIGGYLFAKLVWYIL
jgi:hypothetical protein